MNSNQRTIFHCIFSFFAIILFCNSLNAQNISGSFMHNGVSRSYFYYLPANYNPNQAVPLILNLHGHTSNNTQQQFYTEFDPIADTAGFIMVYPQGTNSVYSGLPFWNYNIYLETADDIGFLNALIDTISSHHLIDASRVYCTGMSNGGFMSYFMALYSNRFAATASVTGSMAKTETGSPITPIPIMEIHGTADASVPYNGDITMRPIEEVVTKWVNWNQCDPMPTMTPVPDINTTDGATAEHYVYKNGIHGNTVEFYKIIGGAHSWPGALPVLGVTCQDFSASKEIWRFFSQYSRPELLATSEANQLLFEIFPNPTSEEMVVLSNTNLTFIRIYDLHGKLVQGTELNGEMTPQIAVSGLANGSYLLEATDGNHVVRKKLLIER